MARRAPSSQDGWLPHLAGGASVWRIAADLNAPSIFDGRLLVPTVRGPEELPDEVQWNHTGLLPLREAIARDREAVRTDLAALCRCLDRTKGLFEQDGYEDFEEAFTLPSVEVDDGAHYLWREVDHKVVVQNWGASPRARGTPVVVYDRLHWDAFRRSVEAVVGPLEAPAGDGDGRDQDREASPASERQPRPWALAIFALVLAAGAAGWALTSTSPSTAPAPLPSPSPAPAAPPAPSTSAAPAPPIPAPHQTILFALGRHDFDDSQLSSLRAIADYLEQHRQVTRLRIEGHADYLGLEHENQPLSRQRAQRVARWLVAHGVDAGRLAPVGCSERYPLDRAESAEARRRNRRVEFFVLEPPGVEGPAPHVRCEP